MAQFNLLFVDKSNYKTHPKLEYSNVIALPKVYKEAWDDPRPYQIWYGPRFTAKSWTKAIQLLLKADDREYFRCVFARNTQKAARESQFQLFQDTLKRWPLLGEKFDILKQEMKIVHKHNGNFLQGGSFEKPDSLMSVPDVTDFWAEEPISRLGSIDRGAFLDISGTLRNPYGIIPQFHFTFNPIGKMNFIYEDFFKPGEEKYFDDAVCKLKPMPHDNPFCPQDRLDFLERMKATDPDRYKVDALGYWGEPRTGSEFYQNWRESIHVKPCRFNPELAIHYVMDYNFNPYMPSFVAQIDRVDGIVCFRIIKEYALKSPLNSIEASCDAFKRDFLPSRTDVFLYDDATGKAGQPIKDPEINSYRKRFKKELEGLVNQYRFRNVNPPVVDRRSLMNEILAGDQGYVIEVDPGCVHTIEDFAQIKVDHNGKKLKEKYTAKEQREGKGTGEKRGHYTDMADYMCYKVVEMDGNVSNIISPYKS